MRSQIRRADAEDRNSMKIKRLKKLINFRTAIYVEMAEHFVFAKLFLLAIFLTNICEIFAAYQPPLATVQPLHPAGIRISIPGKMIKF